MVIELLAALLAAHQPVEGLRVALHRGEDIVDHRLDEAGLDGFAETGLEEQPRDHALRAIGDARGLAELAGDAARGGGAGDWWVERRGGGMAAGWGARGGGGRWGVGGGGAGAGIVDLAEG